MLAEITTPLTFEQIGIWTCCALIFLDLYFRWDAGRTAKEAAKAARDRAGEPTEVKPQPFVVKAHDESATKVELQQVEAKLNRRIDEVDEDLQAQKQSIITNGEVRRKSIEGKVEDVRKELKSDVEKVSGQVSSLVATTKEDVGELRGELKQIGITLINMNQSLQHLQINQGKDKH